MKKILKAMSSLVLLLTVVFFMSTITGCKDLADKVTGNTQTAKTGTFGSEPTNSIEFTGSGTTGVYIRVFVGDGEIVWVEKGNYSYSNNTYTLIPTKRAQSTGADADAIATAKNNIDDAINDVDVVSSYEANLSGDNLSIGASDIAPASGPMGHEGSSLDRFEGVWLDDTGQVFTFHGDTFLIEREDNNYDKEEGNFTFTETMLTFNTTRVHHTNGNWDSVNDSYSVSYHFTDNNTFIISGEESHTVQRQ
ncbi:MAG: hypothetical protein LBT79_04650 [Elusimicrobiota bacterium]|jgi:hypothetical protein|nr:hypothetical protein [Elusimicrobiota bacterium]